MLSKPFCNNSAGLRLVLRITERYAPRSSSKKFNMSSSTRSQMAEGKTRDPPLGR
jgi:hypothetical protein